MKKILYITMFLIMTFSVSATCTVTFGKEIYNPTETITATMVCSSSSETVKGYTLTWTNATQTLQTDTGTTPSAINEPFFNTYTIPSTLINQTITATLTGNNLEGSDTANTTNVIGNSLLIQDCQFKPSSFIGSVSISR